MPVALAELYRGMLPTKRRFKPRQERVAYRMILVLWVIVALEQSKPSEVRLDRKKLVVQLLRPSRPEEVLAACATWVPEASGSAAGGVPLAVQDRLVAVLKTYLAAQNTTGSRPDEGMVWAADRCRKAESLVEVIVESVGWAQGWVLLQETESAFKARLADTDME